MRRVIAVDLMSLDGVMESPEGWAIEREVEDLKAVIDEAGGWASVFGSSGNGIFALEAAACGLTARILKLAEATRVLAAGYLVGGRRRDG
jgi:hypothetical protein